MKAWGMKPCTHGMPSPASCVECMEDGNIQPRIVPPERRDGPVFGSRFDGSPCGVCVETIFLNEPIVHTNRDRFVHAKCVA